MAKREIEGYGVVKHSRFDKVENTYDVTLNCQFRDKDGKVFIADNLNFSKMSPETHSKLLNILGVDELNGFTPMYVTIFRPEGEKKIDEWEEFAHPPEEDKKGKQEKLKGE